MASSRSASRCRAAAAHLDARDDRRLAERSWCWATAKNGTGSAAWPFDKPQYMLLNLAIGGDMAGAVDDSIFPRAFEVDYVRIYQRQ